MPIIPETEGPKRCGSIVSFSSDSSTASSTDVDSPFMFLVDAATSLLDAQNPLKGISSSPLTPEAAKVPVSVEVALRSQQHNPQKKQNFAELLMSVLEDPANQEAITWMPSGKAFTIKNHKKFTMDQMPKIFNIRNMSSFVRKLSRWGFHRVHEKETRNSDIFRHPHFQQGNWELCKKVKCIGGQTSPSSPAKKQVPMTIPRAELTPSPRSVVATHTVAHYPASCGVRLPSPPLSPDKRVMFRMEQARRTSSHSHPPSFHSRGGITHMTSNVVGAAIETLGRDEDTVLVAMPKRYLGTRHAKGIRVLTTFSSRPSYFEQQRSPRSSMIHMPPNHHPSDAAAAMRYVEPVAPRRPMDVSYGRVPRGWALSTDGRNLEYQYRR